MSGDVQPRKRKDKKKRKDELGVEEPRGTAAALGEGDVFIHSYHEHGTGGHWCAKIIFFSLLAVLVTLIGLIILENRGLTELEANAVESRYSGVLEGWIEDTPDDHHDEHTLELTNPDHDDGEVHDDDIGDHEEDDEHENGHDEDSEAEDEDDDQDDEEGEIDDHTETIQESDEDNKVDADNNQSDEEADEDNTEYNLYQKFGDQHVEGDLNEDDDDIEGVENRNYYYKQNKDQVDSEEQLNQNRDSNDKIEESDEINAADDDEWLNEEDGPEDDVDEDDGEVEKIEKEISDEDILSAEASTREEIEDIAEDDGDSEEKEKNNIEENSIEDDDDEPPVEQITGNPYTEVEEETIQKTQDTLAEEEEYEQQQEELKKEREAQSSESKGGGNAFEENWPGEPSDPYWSQQLDLAEEDLRQGSWSSCERRASAAELGSCARAQWLVARCLDFMAEAKRDNKILSRAIAVYLQLLKQNERLPDQKLVDVAHRAIDRIQFRGTYLNAEPIYRLLIRRFPDNVHYRNNLTVSFLMANRADLAASVLKETLLRWPDDRIALGHYGYVLKNQYNLLTEAVTYLEKALEDDVGAANEPRFYYHLGDALLQLGKFGEAHEVHKRGAAQGHFLSPEQRSLYNVPRLKSRPWWPIETTPYIKLARALETSWREILKEGLAAKEFYEKEKEGLKERGEWSQLDIIVRGKEVPGRCKRAPVTCSIVKSEAAAAGCRRGQVKFSAIEPGTHVRPHVGPTNCRLRMHLGLSNTKDTFIRVGQETRQWEIGKVFIFDDSFEHEVWHNGTGSRLVLIVDVWHPDLTPTERRTLPAI